MGEHHRAGHPEHRPDLSRRTGHWPGPGLARSPPAGQTSSASRRGVCGSGTSECSLAWSWGDHGDAGSASGSSAFQAPAQRAERSVCPTRANAKTAGRRGRAQGSPRTDQPSWAVPPAARLRTASTSTAPQDQKPLPNLTWSPDADTCRHAQSPTHTSKPLRTQTCRPSTRARTSAPTHPCEETHSARHAHLRTYIQACEQAHTCLHTRVQANAHPNTPMGSRGGNKRAEARPRRERAWLPPRSCPWEARAPPPCTSHPAPSQRPVSTWSRGGTCAPAPPSCTQVHAGGSGSPHLTDPRQRGGPAAIS